MTESKQVDKGLLVALNCLKKLQLNGIATDAIQISRVQTSKIRPNRRQVFRLDLQSGRIAIKFDRHAMDSDLLAAEFAKMKSLERIFPADGPLRIARPIFLDPRGAFIATEWVDAPTAREVIRNTTTPAERAEVFRRAGAWLGQSHTGEASGEATFRLNVLREKFANRMRRISAKRQTLVHASALERIYREAEATLDALHGRKAKAVFAHGDFHGNNLLMSQTETIGIDFGRTNRKLAVPDIAEFLVDMDLLRSIDPSEMAASGVSAKAEAAFLAGYGHFIDTDSLTSTIYQLLFKKFCELLESESIDEPATIAQLKELERRLSFRLEH